MVCKIIFCSEFPDIPDKAGRKTRRRRTRSPGTASVCFSVVTDYDEHRKPGFKIKRRG